MKIVGVICEYNPFHLGHRKQLDWIRHEVGEDCGIVCLMSGNFVQRGHPAIVDKSLRAKAALECGADLVLELPANISLASAEGFAAGGVAILSPFCDAICFGAEDADGEKLMALAKTLLSEDFRTALRQQLDTGLSFPAARARAVQDMGLEAGLLQTPNNILAVEYCKAILSQGSSMEILPICRQGSYHDILPDSENPSATALRQLLLSGGDWQSYVPQQTVSLLSEAELHTLGAGERAVLARLRCMTEEEFSQIPYGSEGLWRKLMHAVREQASLEDILTAVKSKRYTRTRLDRMVLCAFLGLTERDLQTPAPYVRVLGFSQRGREVLKQARTTGDFPNAGEPRDCAYWQKEQLHGDLYGLFTQVAPEKPGQERRRRVCIK